MTRRPSTPDVDAMIAFVEDELGPLAPWQRDVIERVLRHPDEQLVLQIPRRPGRAIIARALDRIEELR